jgi:hypothetical protein
MQNVLYSMYTGMGRKTVVKTLQWGKKRLIVGGGDL